MRAPRTRVFRRMAEKRRNRRKRRRQRMTAGQRYERSCGINAAQGNRVQWRRNEIEDRARSAADKRRSGPWGKKIFRSPSWSIGEESAGRLISANGGTQLTLLPGTVAGVTILTQPLVLRSQNLTVLSCDPLTNMAPPQL